jgi:hypothetical protein
MELPFSRSAITHKAVYIPLAKERDGHLSGDRLFCNYNP